MPPTPNGPTDEDGAAAHRLLPRAAAFVGIFALLQGLYGTAKGTWLERLVIDQVTVRPAAWFIGVADPDLGVQPAGPRLWAPGGGINVLNGCEGMDVLFLLIGAMLASPLPWRARLSGVLAGAAVVVVLNQARIIALFYAFRGDKAWFDMLHGLIAPMLLMIAVAGFFMAWMHRHAPRSHGHADEAGRPSR